jgi:hypothetical protein
LLLLLLIEPYENPAGSISETDGFLGGNQWFPWEKPMVSYDGTGVFCHPDNPSAISKDSFSHNLWKYEIKILPQKVSIYQPICQVTTG